VGKFYHHEKQYVVKAFKLTWNSVNILNLKFKVLNYFLPTCKLLHAVKFYPKGIIHDICPDLKERDR